ncbi:protein phosphatase PHLPP-like protein [Copidosoma floridanum]|uniref:protein phosphatase PHLPP-like protein n=1 Tax=Copidosoma floridanum TaxID=29053 RepID=UPI000C6FC9C2|nr:protein phosphatase PHLPP-like protein [Copidosoma floridanum]
MVQAGLRLLAIAEEVRDSSSEDEGLSAADKRLQRMDTDSLEDEACRASLATSEEEEEEDEADGQQQKEGAVAAGRVNKLDMSGSGVARLPEAARAFHGVREFFLGHNQLAQLDGNLKLLHSFPELRELHLENNRLTEIPRELLSLGRLTFLDLSDNGIHRIPAGIASLTSLRELILDRNDVKELPDEIVELRRLEHLSLVGNLIELLPGFLLEMRALALADVLGSGGNSRPDNVSSPGTSKLATSSSSSFSSTSSSSFSAAASTPEEKSSVHNNVLSKVNLRNNQLKGNIILGNYGNVTHLDLSENNIETLDLSALQELRSVRCARNQLTELTLCGRSLVSLIAGNNKLKVLSVSPVPVNLEHLDVSYNELDSLPEWTPELPVLRALFASHNKLTALPDRLLSQPTASRLEVLHLPHNRLQALPPPRRQLSLVHLTLQDNALTALPANFFANTLKMKVLNLSNNRLSELPGVAVDGNNVNGGQKARNEAASSLEKIYLTSNSLTNTALDVLAKFSALRVLHLAYNALDTLPEICVASWKELEELVLSGNKLQYLPDNVASLAHLRVLRVHSNRLLRCPAFNRTPSLKVLDLAHNHLEHLNLDSLLSSQLQFLDISCNSRLHVDPRQFQSYHSTRRPVSLVDVSGQSKSTVCTPETSATSSNNSSPSTGASARNDSVELNHHLPWRLGFSETTGARERLLISQLRMPAFCGTECLFGLFDGCSSQEAPSSLQEMIPRLLLDESAVKETRSEYLRYTLLSAQRELREKGQKYGIDAGLVHVTRLEPEQLLDDDDGGDRGRPRYLLTAATCGEARAVLCRASGPLQLAKSTRLVGLPRLQAALAQGRKVHSATHDLLPIALPEPTSEEVVLEEDDEFVIIGNRRLWEVLSIQEAVRQARAEANPVLAAKRLQDLGQAYGAEDNLSVIVLRLSMANATAAMQAEAGLAACANNGFYLNGVLRNVVSARSSAKSSKSSQGLSKDASSVGSNPHQREDRSSPSGQSDQTTSDVGLFEPRSRRRTSGRTGGRFCSGSASAGKIRQLQGSAGAGSVAGSERSPPPSDEQLRCWEYMLEQNTQLLFDKELDTLTSAPSSTSRSTALRRGGQSRSTPQLGSSTGVPFLSRRFGSARSFETTSGAGYQQPLVQPVPVIRSAFGGSARRLLNGGPNAAYFGSLQRLMPYNLEYDFAVIQERGALDSLEQDASRMQQYWGVATTEL